MVPPITIDTGKLLQVQVGVWLKRGYRLTPTIANFCQHLYYSVWGMMTLPPFTHGAARPAFDGTSSKKYYDPLLLAFRYCGKSLDCTTIGKCDWLPEGGYWAVNAPCRRADECITPYSGCAAALHREHLCVNGFVDPARVGIGRIIYNPHQERKEPIHVYRCVCGEGLDGA